MALGSERDSSVPRIVLDDTKAKPGQRGRFETVSE